MDASNLIKPVLTNGEIRCIGSTTYQEYGASSRKDHALARRFQKIDVVEPSVAETVERSSWGSSLASKSITASTYANDGAEAARSGLRPHQRAASAPIRR